MSATTESLAVHERSTVVRVLMAGAAVGILDMLYPIILYAGVLRTATPIRIPQSVASGLLGPAAYQGGLATAALGLLLHFTIACGWTFIYLVLSRWWKPLRQLITTTEGRVKAGLLFGLVVWIGMTFVVVPLSRAGQAPLLSLSSLLQLIWHPVGVGLPIALIVRGEQA